MKLDTKALRYLAPEDWRVLTAVRPTLSSSARKFHVTNKRLTRSSPQVETGSRNHEVVPTPLIAQISGLRGSSAVHRSISNLAKVNLIARVKNARCKHSLVLFLCRLVTLLPRRRLSAHLRRSGLPGAAHVPQATHFVLERLANRHGQRIRHSRGGLPNWGAICSEDPSAGTYFIP